MFDKLIFSTNQTQELVDLTSQIKEVILKSKIKEGVCVVFIPHATGALIVNENENGLKKDILETLLNLIPDKDYLHNQIDNNAKAHILSAIIGTDVTFIIKNGKLQRGTWQNIFFVELDGPRTKREAMIQIK